MMWGYVPFKIIIFVKFIMSNMACPFIDLLKLITINFINLCYKSDIPKCFLQEKLNFPYHTYASKALIRFVPTWIII